MPAARESFQEAVARWLPVVGRSRAIEDLLQLVQSLSGTDTQALITGESGTGKEHVARLLCETGARRGPYLAHNCAALAEGTLESDLFGHVAGAFTGALGTRRGLFEEAHGGTLFLDEIGDIGAKLQAQLLRVLQEGEIRRVGESRSRKVDVRVLAATHRDLASEVRSGRFREDLYYRLNLVQVPLPPLRERRTDIPLFVKHFLAESVRGHEPMCEVVRPPAMEALLCFEWPGNVRQLRNEILRAAILTRGRGPIEADSFSFQAPPRGGIVPPSGSLQRRLEAAQRSIVLEALTANGWNKTRVARGLGISRQGLIKMMHRLEVPLAEPADG
ncbi:MAG: hypothetical protein DHS20C21_24340 [Gemmatimonadota bacterium]|nr:MAG: hypothetical protein DHS20C21_24340 [Gemmatimonadota bacterium]